MDLMDCSLYVLFSYFRPCDVPSENYFFQKSSYPRAHVCVGVQCYHWFKFCSPLFAGVLMSLKQVRIFYIKPQHMHDLI